MRTAQMYSRTCSTQNLFIFKRNVTIYIYIRNFQRILTHDTIQNRRHLIY